MPGSLYQILNWAKENGEVECLSRIRLKLLIHSVKEKIFIDDVGPNTNCSDEYLQEVRKAVGEVVGKNCPL
ncbi:MAG: hypothetical protein HY548_04540 [Elusimicrobia bacterium]|nr:hypothetical protein [Elusimicrobiota bacterium]